MAGNPIIEDYTRQRLILNIIHFLDKTYHTPAKEPVFNSLLINVQAIYGVNYSAEKNNISAAENLYEIFPEPDQGQAEALPPKNQRILNSIFNFFIQESAYTSNILSAIVKLTGVVFEPNAGDGENKSLLNIFCQNQESLLLNRGNDYSTAQDYQNAIEAYNNALRYRSTNEVIYYNRALAYYNLQNYERCIEDVEATTRLNPNFAPAFILGGDAHMALHLYLDASHYYDQALHLVPGEPSYQQKLNAALASFEGIFSN